MFESQNEDGMKKTEGPEAKGHRMGKIERKGRMKELCEGIGEMDGLTRRE
jgi:hypothetical protein